ncbi:GlcG/HbpS family heme-binding protein [Shimia abyssi]|uniref:Uncharacterized protein GlcG (DUF336 family) n=1 Tax=Shimia abyssi TaxID=1662395 RepID=A0A2P8FJK4_9RHOB|nr:heme-binding protein [Shimia abyssi]PSL21900.1 uncharacterized protein GlcG (DUF336 family) [Shimia abyssi]
MGISLKKARVIVRKTLQAGRDMDLKPLSVIVVDAGGHVQAFEREDGASPGRFQIAQGKAYAAVMLGIPSSSIGNMAIERPHFGASLNAAFDGKVIPVAGGVLIKDRKGEIVGAVGVTGDTSDNDAAAALAGVQEAGLEGVA